MSKSKKIGILTFHDADNVGAVLQAYALQKTFENIGATAEIIDYKCECVLATKKVKKPRTVKEIIFYIIKSAYYIVKSRGFNKFRKRNFVCSKEVYNSDTIHDCTNNYEAIVVGSDQVWNMECSGWDFNYFLDFASDDVRKISYAASIGNYNFLESEYSKTRSLLEKFESVSVREKSAVDKLRKIGLNTNTVAIHCDPVFLFDADQWQSIMAKRPISQKYVFVYMIAEDDRVALAASEYARSHGYKLINNKKSIEYILRNSPSYFLAWIYYAECVFTNSFHGTAFSMIFNKGLTALLETHDGQINSRIYDLLAENDVIQCSLGVDNTVALEQAHLGTALISSRDSAMEYLKNIVS